jgi:hypothetical protein
MAFIIVRWWFVNLVILKDMGEKVPLSHSHDSFFTAWLGFVCLVSIEKTWPIAAIRGYE